MSKGQIQARSQTGGDRQTSPTVSSVNLSAVESLDLPSDDVDKDVHFENSKYYKLYRVEKTLGALEGTIASLTTILEGVANKRAKESEAMKESVADIAKYNADVNHSFSRFYMAARKLAGHTLKVSAVAGGAIGSLVLTSGFAKNHFSDSVLNKGLVSSALGVVSLALYQIYYSAELSQLTQASKGLMNSLSQMKAAGESLLGASANTGTEMIKDIGDIAASASEVSGIAKQAISELKAI